MPSSRKKGKSLRRKGRSLRKKGKSGKRTGHNKYYGITATLTCTSASCKSSLLPNGCRSGRTCQVATNTATGAKSCACVATR